MRLNLVRALWITGVMLLGLTVLGVLAVALFLRIEPDLAPRYDGGPLTVLETQREEVLERAHVDSHGLKHGPVTWWRDGVQVGGGRYVDGLLHGLYWTDWPGGVRAEEIEHAAGSFHGPARGWYASGRLESLGTYMDGRRAGPWQYFDEQGKPDLARSGFYVDDRRLHGLDEVAPAPRPVPADG